MHGVVCQVPSAAVAATMKVCQENTVNMRKQVTITDGKAIVTDGPPGALAANRGNEYYLLSRAFYLLHEGGTTWHSCFN